MPVWLVIGCVGLAMGVRLALPAYTAQHATGMTLTHMAVIELPGPPGRRFDYLTIDGDGHYLFSAHLAAGLLYVIDLRTNTVLKAIPDVPGVEGVAYVPELKKVYTSNWWENTIGVIWPPMAAPAFLDADVRRGIGRGAPDWRFTDGVTVGVSLASAPGIVWR
jgi:hypothetical protein